MRITLIHNPGAGQDEQPGTDDLMRVIRDAGHDVVAHAGDDLRGLTPATIDDTCELIAVAGGDGTIGRVIKKLLDCPVPLTLIPMGTANNIARSLGLAADTTLAQLVAGWDGADTRSIDVGVIEGPWGTEHFVEGVGVGLFTRTMLEIDALHSLDHLTTPEEKLAEALAIMIAKLRTFSPRRLDLRLDGRDLSGDYLMLEAMNIRFVGPNLYVAPGCDPGDGLLDVVLVAEADRANLLAHLASWRRGQLRAPTLPTYRGAHLQIEWHGNPLHVDDEAWPPAGAREVAMPARIDLRARKHALQVRVPITRSS